ncbi:MAG: RNA 2'-phosphotransferase [Desulfobacterales bacterium]|nr:RNA 2'-phosphotransferase [Desulfobacterales bacterium]
MTQSNYKKLHDFICYILGRKPDEFGLIPDNDGYIKIKDLLKVFSEEDGWKYVRKTHIDESFVNTKNKGFEIREDLIRAIDRKNLPIIKAAENPPKLIYTSIRENAYPHIMEKGIIPTFHKMVVLSSNISLAERIGKRRDHKSVLLTVNVSRLIENNIALFNLGEFIYLTDLIPTGCFTVPSSSKHKIEKEIEHKKEVEAKPKMITPTPGSFIMDLNKENKPSYIKGKKKITWKEDRKRTKRKQKHEYD